MSSDSTLAEFLIHLHTQSNSFDDFKAQCATVGAEFPLSFLQSVDRLVLSMHPKYKKKVKKSKKSKKTDGEPGSAVVDEHKQQQARLFPGLALPDQEWKPSNSYAEDNKPREKVVFDDDLGVDQLMAELEGVGAKRGEKRPREGRSASPPDRSRARSPDFERRGRDNGYGNQDKGGYPGDRGRDGYGGGGPRGRPTIDQTPIIYKVYPGKVSNIKDFGAFVTLEGVAGRVEGKLFVFGGGGSEWR